MGHDADRWRLVALCLLAFVAPFNFFGSRSNDVLRLPLVVLALVLAVTTGASAWWADRRLTANQRRFFGLWFVWVLLLWVSTLLSPDRWVSAGAAARFSVAAMVMAATVLVVKSRSHAERILRWLIAGALVAVTLGAMVQLLGRDIAESGRFFGAITKLGPYDRLTRPWSHANVAAMAIGASIAGAAAFRTPQARFAAAAAMVVGIVLTYSRGGFAALALGGIVWAVLRTRTQNGTWTELKPIAVLAVIAVLTAMILPGWIGRTSGDDRLAWWQVDLRVPAAIQLGADAATTTIGITNLSSVVWPREGDEAVLITARWVPAGTDTVRAEHRWELPMDLSPGDRIDAGLTLDPFVPNGDYQVHWDLLIEERAYFRQFAGLATVISQGTVAGASIDDSAPPVGSIVPPRRFPSRTEIWSSAADAFTESPFWGVGPALLGETIPEGEQVSHGHNLVLEPLATWGLLPSLPFLALIAGAVVLAWKRADQDGELSSAAVVTGLVVVVAHGMVDWPLVHVSVAIPIGLLCGLGWASSDGTFSGSAIGADNG